MRIKNHNKNIIYFILYNSDVSRDFLEILFPEGDFWAEVQKDINVRVIFSYNYVSKTWVWVIYYGECNDYVLVNSITHCVRGEFIQNYFKIFTFLTFY